MNNFMSSSTIIIIMTTVGLAQSTLVSKKSSILTLIERLITDMLHSRQKVTTTTSI